MVQMLVVRAGSTEFDEQGRIKGTLDIPLSDAGQGQVGRLIADLHATTPHPKVDVVGRHLDQLGLGRAVRRINGDIRHERTFRELLNADVVLWYSLPGGDAPLDIYYVEPDRLVLVGPTFFSEGTGSRPRVRPGR